MSWISKLEGAKKPTVPWTSAVERVLPGGVNSISTVAILDLMDVPVTTGNARRIAAAMRALGFVPIKSRRLPPGGNRGTNIRGWARPERQSGPHRLPEVDIAQQPEGG
jgi:hypothetical protein